MQTALDGLSSAWTALQGVLEMPWVHAGVISAVGIALGLAVALLLRRVVGLITRRRDSIFDDLLVRHLRFPVAITLGIGGVWYAAIELGVEPFYERLLTGVLWTVPIVSWALAMARVSGLLIRHFGTRPDRPRVLQPRTQPMFEMAAKVLAFTAALYFIFAAWDIDPTVWLTSAGILGIAVGFAAQHTLGNVFAGIAIVADVPFKLGDFLVLATGERGRVVEIGLRATRIVTPDNIEIVVPNNDMANSKIVNETGGPTSQSRVGAQVGVAYGTDIDHVRDVLLAVGAACVEAHPNVTSVPAPQVLFLAFGGSSLDFRLNVWLEQPRGREEVLDWLHVHIYKAFAENRIEIPFQQVDLHVKPMAAPRAAK